MIFKYILLIIGAFLLFIYVLPLFETKLNIGNIFGIIVSFGIITVGFLFDMLKKSSFFWIALSIACIMLILFLGILFYIIKHSKRTATNETTVIILGCRVKGTKPSLSLYNRCKVASVYLEENESAVVILSGGQGADELISEAECMKDLMLEFGIDESRIYLENKSTSTHENIAFSKDIIEKHNLSSSVVIATSEYHEARAIMIAKKYGFSAKSLPSKTLNRIKVPVYTREVFGIIKELLR